VKKKEKTPSKVEAPGKLTGLRKERVSERNEVQVADKVLLNRNSIPHGSQEVFAPEGGRKSLLGRKWGI